MVSLAVVYPWLAAVIAAILLLGAVTVFFAIRAIRRGWLAPRLARGRTGGTPARGGGTG